MANSDPLSQLKDIHLTEPVSWWPLAPGWWILLILVILVLFLLVRYLIKRSKPDANLHFVKMNVEQLKKSSPSKDNLSSSLQLIRRVAINYLPKNEVASIPYDELVNKISNTVSYQWSQTSLALLNGLHYQQQANIQQTHWLIFLQDIEQSLTRLISSSMRRIDHKGVKANAR